MKRLRGGLVFKAHRLSNHSTLGVRVIKTKKSDKLATNKLMHDLVSGLFTSRHTEFTSRVCQLGACKGPASESSACRHMVHLHGVEGLRVEG